MLLIDIRVLMFKFQPVSNFTIFSNFPSNWVVVVVVVVSPLISKLELSRYTSLFVSVAWLLKQSYCWIEREFLGNKTIFEFRLLKSTLWKRNGEDVYALFMMKRVCSANILRFRGWHCFWDLWIGVFGPGSLL